MEQCCSTEELDSQTARSWWRQRYFIQIKITLTSQSVALFEGGIELVGGEQDAGGELTKGNVYVNGNQGFIEWQPNKE